MATESEWAARDLAEAEDRYERCARDYSELCTAFHERGRRIKELEKSLADAKAEGRREAFEEAASEAHRQAVRGDMGFDYGAGWRAGCSSTEKILRALAKEGR